MRQDLIKKAEELNIPLTRSDIKCLNVRGGVTVKQIREFIEGLDDRLEFELGYYAPEGLDYAELYHHVWVDKTEKEVEHEIEEKLKLIERNNKLAAEQEEQEKISELSRIKSLEKELKRLKKKHKV